VLVPLEHFDSELSDVGNPLARQLEDTYFYQGLSASTSRPTEEVGCTAGLSRPPPQSGQVDATSSTQHCSATLTEVLRVFPQLQGKCQGINENEQGPPTPDHGGLQPKRSPPPKCRRNLQPKRLQFWVQLPGIHPTIGQLLIGIISHQKQIHQS
jgi:hypothetical protein